MTIQVLSVTMDEKKGLRSPQSSSPILAGIAASLDLQHTDRLLSNAGILAGVGRDEPCLDQLLFKRNSLADTSGIVSHLRASATPSSASTPYAARQDIDATLRAKGRTTIGSSFAQQLQLLSLYRRSLSSLPGLENHTAQQLLLSPTATARDAALASLAQSLSVPSTACLPPSMLPQTLPVPSSLSAFNVSNQLMREARLAQLAQSMAASAAAKQHKRSPVVLFMECDEDSLSEYQCLIRKQIELFEADKEEAASSVQGRNKQIVEGQVGIRCRHCNVVPPRQRQKGCMYFPTKLDRIYQAAQNLSVYHLCQHCKHVPSDVRKKIMMLRERKSPAGGGKNYWGEGVRCLDVYEDSNGLRFRKA